MTSPPPAPLAVEAPAKLNLSLAVTGRRPDGYHDLASTLVLLELADRLLLMPGCSGLRVEAPAGDDVPLDGARNLAWRGLVAGLGSEPELACLTLEKRVPVAAGLGGGSSDAAAAWRLGRRWVGAADQPSPGDLPGLARIGADVPFFAAQHVAARVTGIGERVEPIAPPDPPAEVVLVHPPFRLETAAVFEALRPADWSGAPAATATDPSQGAIPGRNDLLAAARRLRPEIEELARLVLAAGAEPHLTGSGPTLFAWCDDAERAAAIADRLVRAGLRATHTRTRRRAASIESIAGEEP